MKLFLCVALVAFFTVEAQKTEPGRKCFKDDKDFVGIMTECLKGEPDGNGPEIKCVLGKMGFLEGDAVKIKELEKEFEKIATNKDVKLDVMKVLEQCKLDASSADKFSDCLNTGLSADGPDGKMLCDDFKHASSGPK